MKRVIAADAFAALPAFLWFYLFQAMANHYAALPIYGYSGTWDFWVWFPLAMGVLVVLSAAGLTFVRRKPGITAVVAGAALLPLLPFVMMISGGV